MSQMKSRKTIFSIIIISVLASTLVFVSPAWARESISTPFRENAEVRQIAPYEWADASFAASAKECFEKMKQELAEIEAARNAAVGKADAAIVELDGWLLDEEKSSLIAHEETMRTAANMDVYNEALAAFDAIVAGVNERIANYVPPQTNSYSSAPSYSAPANGSGLTRSGGVNNYNGHRETYYNLPMGGVISNAQNMGISGNYWVRDDGVKMYDDYVIVASSDYDKGTTIDTSLGQGIVLDYCPSSGTVDIATAW